MLFECSGIQLPSENIVQKLWHCLYIHCLYICPAKATIDGCPVTNAEKIAIMMWVKGANSQLERGGLMKEVELVIGVPVMVMFNIHTDLDVANGVWGEIVEIMLDEHDEHLETKEMCTIYLQHSPRYVLVKLAWMKVPVFEDLEQNVMPIAPITKTFSTNKDGKKITINWTQILLTPAYAFTDYRSQGQTIDPVIVNIGWPPQGHLTPFNVYVVLSRGTSHDHIRLLRDFDKTLMQQHPSEYLRLEDEWLKHLNQMM